MRSFLYSLLFLLPIAAAAQHTSAILERRALHPACKTTNVSTLEDAYDIHHVKLDIALINTGTTVSGNATTTATVIPATGLTQYAFELDSLLTIDSVFINAQPVAATQAGYLRVAALGAALPQGSSFTAQVFYHGATPSGTGFFTHGLNHAQLATGTNITYTVSDPYLAKDWWPCKQSLLDKIDSVDTWVTVPDSLKAGCNGLLKAVTPLPGGMARYQWKTRYPIEYYLICASVAPYVDHSQMLHFTGSSDSMLIQHYVYDTATFLPQYGSVIDSTPYMVDYFSMLYGRYPYWQEKYGHCTAPLGGGMEHQTMTTLGAYQTQLVAHELGHQWWGDKVTYSSWRDIWLSEGWASYTEQLYATRFWGDAAGRNYRTTVFNRVIAAPGGSTYVDDTTDVYRIFSSRLTYDKGAAVAHMLRFVINNDSLYFAALRAYLQQYAFATANTEDFKHSIEQSTGLALDTFFAQWIYGQGYPRYAIRWNQAGSQVFVQLSQTGSSPANTPLFITPVEIALHAATGDTVIRVLNNTAVQQYAFTNASAITGITLDPDDNILNRVTYNLYDSTLAIADAAWGGGITIAPNPARDTWRVAGLPPHTGLLLTNAGGLAVWQQRNASGTAAVPAANLAAGVYYLQLSRAGSVPLIRKLQCSH